MKDVLKSGNYKTIFNEEETKTSYRRFLFN